MKPVQPFFLTTTWRYYKMLPMSGPVVHYYSFAPDSPADVIAIPDGCVDLLFSASKSGAQGHVYGMVRNCSTVALESGMQYFGVRFLPGFLPKRLKISIPELVGQRVPLGCFDGGSLLTESIADSRSFLERVQKVDSYIGGMWATDALLQSLICAISSKNGDMHISELESEVHYSSRYISRVFSRSLGISPKEFASHMRLQGLIGKLNSGGGKHLAALAAEQGFFDQSHCIRDFKRYTSMTPSEYAKAVDLPNYQKKMIVVPPALR